MSAIGIDLGTTNSLVSVFEDDKPKLIPNALGHFLTPSAVSIDGAGNVLVGQAARDRLITHASHTTAGFKRLMGTSHATKLGKQTFRPEELSALVLRALKSDAEAALQKPIDHAIISVPAYFNDLQRKATINAAGLAGLRVDRLVNEPTAAALSYGLANVTEGKYLVFDLGGGTFDVSILDKYEDVMEIRATTGDTRLGGEDFTDVLEGMILRKAHVEISTLDLQSRAILRRHAELAKLALSTKHEADYEFMLSKGTLAGTISRAAFEIESATLLQRLRLPTERAVRDSKMAMKDFDAVVLVGGATRMAMIRAMVAKLFAKLPLASVDPDTTVALGAAVQAALVGRHGALRDVVMTDVCPYTLGVGTVDDPDKSLSIQSVTPIIERNAVIPISRNLVVQTAQNFQRQIEVDIYQGENLRPESNIRLGSVKIAIPRRRKGEEQVDIRFTYDVNGTLQVEVKSLSTGKSVERIFLNEMGLTGDELRARFAALQHLKISPRDEVHNQALLARAERMYEEFRGSARVELRDLIVEFEREIASQTLRDAVGCRERFGHQLDYLESTLN